jgi:L-arabinonolactonase
MSAGTPELLIERVPRVLTSVGESPVWDVATATLLLVDIVEGRVLRVGPADERSEWRVAPFVGAVAPTHDGRLAVVLENGFVVVDPASGDQSDEASAGGGRERITEGKVDRRGRFVAASGDRAFTDPRGALYRWDAPATVSRLDGDIVLGNGVCWSRDGRTLFVADSRRDVIYAYDYDLDGDGVSGRRVFFDAAREDGFPDGATVDAEDHLWSVLHGSPWIVCLDQSGREVRRIEMPTSQISSLAFGGPNLDELYVTSLDPDRIPNLPADAPRPVEAEERGLLYRVRGLGVTGLPEVPVSHGFTMLDASPPSVAPGRRGA